MNRCSLVWDGKNFNVPEALGKPREDQLLSTPIDNLCELAGRTCYDSLGSGRNSTDYHKHIIEVNHLSVYEHANLTFLIPDLDLFAFLPFSDSIINRPGIWVKKEEYSSSIILEKNNEKTFDLRITANARAIREWFKVKNSKGKYNQLLGETLQNMFKEKAPLMFEDIEQKDVGPHSCTVTEPIYDEEIWLSMFFTNMSRGVSHELVRHKYMTAVSQRSTRYVDENESPWILHPVVEKYISEKDNPLFQELMDLEKRAKECYVKVIDCLQTSLTNDGADKFTARKQARGAARGFLGNALLTELIFSANLKQWKWMIKSRASRHADAEIRVVFNEVFEILSSKFPDRFVGWEKKDCPDGIGFEV